MRLRYAIPVLALVIAVIMISGCSGVKEQPTPTPAANVSVPAAAGPDSIGTIHSTQIRLESLDVTYSRGREHQVEDISIVLENVGSTEARNVGVSVQMKNLQSGVPLYSKLYLLDRPIPAYGSTTINLTTGQHEDYAFSVIVDLRIYWGDNVEYYNTYKESRTLPFTQPGGTV